MLNNASLPLAATPAAWQLPSRRKAAVAWLIITESAMFTIFVVAYLFYIGKSLTGPYPAEVLETPIVSTICLLASSLTIVIAVFLAYGLYFGLTEGVEKAWVADMAPVDARGTAFGIYNAAIGIGGLAASLLFGAIWTRVSPQAAFLTGAALALAASVLLYLAIPDADDSRHQR